MKGIGDMSRIPMIDAARDAISRIESTQQDAIGKAAIMMARSILSGGMVHIFGSGHSHMMAEEAFPRYGGYVGFNPLMDPRLMWFDVLGSGGVRELLWLEREEGYIANFLQGQNLRPQDVMLVYSHGGLNAAPIEAAMYARELGLKVVAVTSRTNYETANATHSSGSKLGDLADVLIDNCIPPEDALVEIPGLGYKVGPGSTIAGIVIMQVLVTEVARELVSQGFEFKAFVSPNVTSVPKQHNQSVFEDFAIAHRTRTEHPVWTEGKECK
jgi:uncharacterized phosphosugar-binding protein